QQWAAARAAFEAALAANPTATNSHFYAAFAAYRLGDHDGAELHAAAFAAASTATFADVVRGLQGEARGQAGAVLQFLADRAWRQGRKEPCRDLNHVLAWLLDSADAWNNCALLCRETGRFEAALEAYGRALAKEPDSPQLLNDTAVVLQHHLPNPDNLARARGMYERAIQLADRLLQQPSLPTGLRERTQKARADAAANLAELPK
ncbi:MAG: tetratricopeptide repeat protein, partial [Planctomycetes bacterium]|nr:tetratricopeptide repeat protein [Planctomycetota bacterium]